MLKGSEYFLKQPNPKTKEHKMTIFTLGGMTPVEINHIIDGLCPNLDAATRSRIIYDAAGNPGATKVLTSIAANVVDWDYILSKLENADLRGSEIWVLYKDINKENVEAMVSYIRNHTPGAILRGVMRCRS